jgi:hypothetical protein
VTAIIERVVAVGIGLAFVYYGVVNARSDMTRRWAKRLGATQFAETRLARLYYRGCTSAAALVIGSIFILGSSFLGH